MVRETDRQRDGKERDCRTYSGIVVMGTWNKEGEIKWGLLDAWRQFAAKRFRKKNK